MDHTEHDQRRSSPTGRILGWVIAALLVFLAQRDLRRRPPAAVRGPVALWRVVAGTPPGAVVYLVAGRRRAGEPDDGEPLPV